MTIKLNKFKLTNLVCCLLFIISLFSVRAAIAASPVISERYIIIFDLSGTFIKDNTNIRMSLDKLQRFSEALEQAKKDEIAQIEKEAKGRRQPLFENTKRVSELTIIGMGLRSRPIWSGSAANFMDLNNNGEIRRLIQNTVDESARTGNNKCTDIRGALDLGFRRLKATNTDRELIVRAGIIVFSDLLDDPPDQSGNCKNTGSPVPPEGAIWDDLTSFIEENQDRFNTTPAFLPKFTFIALGVNEQPDRTVDPVSLWTERLRSIEDKHEPFLLEFRSFADAINFSILPPERSSLSDIQNYLNNFDPLEGKRIANDSSRGNQNNSGMLKTGLVLILGIAGLIFLIILLIVVVIIVIIVMKKRRASRAGANPNRGDT